MRELTLKEKNEIMAGGLSALAFAAIASGISFVVGIFDGITRVLKCH